jgi:NRE family putative nickel resistance protein-like MFS transporter
VFAVVRDPEVRSLWMSQWISDAGSFVTFVALAVYIHSLTGGIVAVGFALGLRSIAGFLFGPIAGVWADRLDRRAVMITCDLARAVLVAALPFTHVAWEAYVLAFTSALFSPLYRAARTAFTPSIAPGPKLVPALTVGEATHHVLHMVGPAFGGLVVLAVGARFAFFLDAASFVLSAAFLSTIRSRGRPTRAARSSVLREFRDGLAAVIRTPTVRTYMLLNAALAFAGAGVVALLVVYVRDILHLPGGEFGLVLAMAGLGTVATTVVIATRDDRHPRTPWAVVSALAGGVFVFAAFEPSLVPLLFMGLVFGLTDGGIDVPYGAVKAELLQDHLRGRAAGASEGFGDLCYAAGSIGFAWLAGTGVGISRALALAGGASMVLSLAVLGFGGAEAIARSERVRLAGVRTGGHG